MSYLGHRYEFRLMSVNKSTILDFDAFGDELAVFGILILLLQILRVVLSSSE